MEGNLEAMSLPSLVQFAVQECDQAVIQLEHGTDVGKLYIDNGQLCHAELENSMLGSEEVVYSLLHWKKGKFKVHQPAEMPAVTIQKSWVFLMMEGLKRVDEAVRPNNESERIVEKTTEEIISNLSESDATMLQDIVAQQKDFLEMANLENTLESFMQLDGAIAAALVDWESGMTLGTIGNGMDINLAAAGNTNVVRSKLAIMKDLKLKGGIEDILITLTDQYHLIRLMEKHPNLFIYVALSRHNANLGMARHRLSSLEKELSI